MTAGTASELSYHPRNKSRGMSSQQRLPNKQGSMADSYYNLVGPKAERTNPKSRDIEDVSSPPRPVTGEGVHYEQINAQNINANIRRSMDRQQRVQTAQPNKLRAKKAY